MPLLVGRSQAVISANIAELVRSGRPVAQAAAIAYKKAGIQRRRGIMSKRRYGKRKKLKMTKSAIAARRRYRKNKRKHGKGRRGRR